MSCDNCGIQKIQNCTCKECSTSIDVDIDVTKNILVPVLASKLYNCIKYTRTDCNKNVVFKYNVQTNSEYKYSTNGKVKINSFSLDYDYIGLPFATINSSEVYINGEITRLTPLNLFQVSLQKASYYIFDEIYGKVNFCSCICNDNPVESQVVRLNQIRQVFVIDHLTITVNGCIDNVPFTAVSIFNDLFTTQALGFTAFDFINRICILGSLKSGYVSIKYNPMLCGSTICPVSSYFPSNDIANSSGYFYGLTNLLFSNTVDIKIENIEPMLLLTNNNKM